MQAHLQLSGQEGPKHPEINFTCTSSVKSSHSLASVYPLLSSLLQICSPFMRSIDIKKKEGEEMLENHILELNRKPHTPHRCVLTLTCVHTSAQTHTHTHTHTPGRTVCQSWNYSSNPLHLSIFQKASWVILGELSQSMSLLCFPAHLGNENKTPDHGLWGPGNWCHGTIPWLCPCPSQ